MIPVSRNRLRQLLVLLCLSALLAATPLLAPAHRQAAQPTHAIVAIGGGSAHPDMPGPNK